MTKKLHSWFKNGFSSNIVSIFGVMLGGLAIWRKNSVLIECSGSLILISNVLGQGMLCFVGLIFNSFDNYNACYDNTHEGETPY